MDRCLKCANCIAIIDHEMNPMPPIATSSSVRPSYNSFQAYYCQLYLLKLLHERIVTKPNFADCLMDTMTIPKCPLLKSENLERLSVELGVPYSTFIDGIIENADDIKKILNDLS